MAVRWIVLYLLAGCVMLSVAAQTTSSHVSGQWLVENAFIRLILHPDAGTFSVLDKRCGYLWRQPEGVKILIRNAQAIQGGVRFETDLLLGEGKKSTLLVTMHIPPKSAEIRITAEAMQPDTPFPGMLFLAPLILDTPQGALAVADYCNGHLYPLDARAGRR